MKAIEFKEVNVRIAEHQEEYETLPVHIDYSDASTPTTICFELSEEEKKQVKETGKIWLTILTFNQNFHPISMSCLDPTKIGKVEDDIERRNKDCDAEFLCQMPDCLDGVECNRDLRDISVN